MALAAVAAVAACRTKSAKVSKNTVQLRQPIYDRKSPNGVIYCPIGNALGLSKQSYLTLFGNRIKLAYAADLTLDLIELWFGVF